MDKYKDITLQSVTREDFNLEDIVKEDKEDKSSDEKEDNKKDYKELLEAIKKQLEGKVTDVRISKRLKSSPVCFVNSNSGTTFNQ